MMTKTTVLNNTINDGIIDYNYIQSYPVYITLRGGKINTNMR